jgi:L-fucose isomerase-like protein
MGLGAKPRFALFFGNRGFFPGSLMASARQEVKAAVEAQGYETLMLDADATRFGAVETPAEGAIYARFLKENEGKFDGIILSLPNFGDETGAVAALQHAGVPILIQAYPDTMDRMEPALRRDSFCGKFSIMDVFCQTGVKFTALKPHTAAPDSAAFKANVDHFARVCSVTSAFKGLVVGAIGARTTAFKTVRIDELALQKHGITMETYDLSEVFCRVRALTDADAAVKDKAATLKAYADFSRVPEESFSTITRMGVVFDQIIEENNLDAVAIAAGLRCSARWASPPACCSAS